MADSDDLDLDGGDVSESGGSARKRSGGLGNLLPTILKFAAIGLGALIFIVTVSVITHNVMRGDGRNQTVVSDPLSPYMGRRPEYAYFELGPMSTRTRDAATVSIDMVIGYDLDNAPANIELFSRRLEIHDFTRRYFTAKYASELVPEKEEEIKKEIREQLNTRFLDTARARIILFRRLDVLTEM